MALDGLDERILGDLQEDGRRPFRAIADKQGVSLGTIHNRVRRMRDEGTLEGIVPLVSDAALGYRFKAITSVRVEGGHLDEVKAALKGLPGIVACWQTSGTFDLVLLARFREMEDWSGFTARIARIQHAKAETNLVMDDLVGACIVRKR